MKKESNNAKLLQKQIAQQLGYWDATNKRYREQINMPSPNIGSVKAKG